MGGSRGPYASRWQLTDRQRRVLELMADGKTNGEIAEALGITLDGAKWHVSAILSKLDVDSREEAVEAWREHHNPGARIRRWAAWPLSPPGWMAGAVKAASAASAVLVLGLAGIVMWWGDEPGDEPAETPESANELLERMAEELSEDDRVLHIETAMVGEEPGREPQEFARFEAWFDFDDEQGRFEFTRVSDNQGDVAEPWTAWFDGQYMYQVGADDESPRRTARGETLDGCLNVAPYMVEFVACGFSFITGSFDASNVRLVRETTWQGEDAIGIAFEHVQEMPEQLRPPETPTPTPLPATPTVAPEMVTFHTSYRFYVEPDTYLPLGVQIEYQRDGESIGEMVYDYEAELLGPGDFDRTLFDPRAAGYRTEEEQEMALLDRVTRDEAVYWLGRSADVGRPVGTVKLLSAEDWFNVERPTRLTLTYTSEAADGRLKIDIWRKGEWQNFLAMLDEAGQRSSNFVYASDCRKTTETTVAGNTVRILAGHDVQPATGAPPTPSRGSTATSGQASTTPTSTPARGECPPRDTYMAAVHMGDYVVTLNAPTSVWGPDGEFGVFNSPEALVAVAAELRERQVGE